MRGVPSREAAARIEPRAQARGERHEIKSPARGEREPACYNLALRQPHVTVTARSPCKEIYSFYGPDNQAL
jgi:hypothetical protein